MTLPPPPIPLLLLLLGFSVASLAFSVDSQFKSSIASNFCTIQKHIQYKKVFPNFYILRWFSTGAEESDMHIHKALTEDWEETLFSALSKAGGTAFSNMVVGYNNVDVEAATKYGVAVGNTPVKI